VAKPKQPVIIAVESGHEDEADYQASLASIRKGGRTISLAALLNKYGYTPEVREYFRKQGARGGRMGAKARMEKLTPEQRTEYARNAAKSRWKAQNGTAAALEPDTKLAGSSNSNSKLFRDGTDQRNHEHNLRLQEKRLKKL
jgi:hypothetical protein